MKHHFQPLFSKASDATDPSPGQSGGRGQESPPPAAAAAPAAVAGGILPIDSLPQAKSVTLHFEKHPSVTGFKDPVFGFMDAAGVALPAGVTPTGWSPLERGL